MNNRNRLVLMTPSALAFDCAPWHSRAPYNLKRLVAMLGPQSLSEAIPA